MERRLLERNEAALRAVLILRAVAAGRQDDKGIGIHGLFFHFLDPVTANRVWGSEVSTVDSAFFFAGALLASAYFDAQSVVEKEIRDLAEELYRRADWNWAMNGGRTLSHGWKP